MRLRFEIYDENDDTFYSYHPGDDQDIFAVFDDLDGIGCEVLGAVVDKNLSNEVTVFFEKPIINDDPTRTRRKTGAADQQ